MKPYKQFLEEATQPEWEVIFKPTTASGVKFTSKPITVKAVDVRSATIKAAKQMGLADSKEALTLKTTSVKKV